MLLRREPSLSSGGDDDIAPKAMPLLCWEEHRTTAPVHPHKWNTTDSVLLFLLSPYLFCHTPAPPWPNGKRPLPSWCPGVQPLQKGEGATRRRACMVSAKRGSLAGQSGSVAEKNTAVVCLAPAVFTPAQRRRCAGHEGQANCCS